MPVVPLYVVAFLDYLEAFGLGILLEMLAKLSDDQA